MDGVAAVERALAIAQALEAARQPLTLTELARDTGLYKSTILRLLVSLERCGLVVRRSDQSYTLGPFAVRLGKAYDACMPLEAALQPLMEQLVREGMESPSFHVIHDAHSPFTARVLDKDFKGEYFIYTLALDSGDVVYAQVHSHHNHPIGSRIGVHIQLDHLIAFGRAA